jgi:hypothetical protein
MDCSSVSKQTIQKLFAENGILRGQKIPGWMRRGCGSLLTNDVPAQSGPVDLFRSSQSRIQAFDRDEYFLNFS